MSQPQNVDKASYAYFQQLFKQHETIAPTLHQNNNDPTTTTTTTTNLDEEAALKPYPLQPSLSKKPTSKHRHDIAHYIRPLPPKATLDRHGNPTYENIIEEANNNNSNSGNEKGGNDPYAITDPVNQRKYAKIIAITRRNYRVISIFVGTVFLLILVAAVMDGLWQGGYLEG